MASIEITRDTLIVHIEGLDQLWSLKAHLEVPLAHIAEVAVNPQDAHGVWHGLRMGGTNLPGVITAGRFLQAGEWAFWDVHDPDRCIEIRLHDEKYGRLVVGVDDPTQAAHAIDEALRSSSPG